MAKAAAAGAASGDTGDVIGKVVKATNAGAAAKGGDATSVNGMLLRGKRRRLLQM